MKVLLDSGVWWRKSGKLPMKKPLADFLENDVTEWWLSPVCGCGNSLQGKTQKIARARRGKLVERIYKATALRRSRLRLKKLPVVGTGNMAIRLTAAWPLLRLKRVSRWFTPTPF